MVGVTATSEPPGASTRAISAALRGANTLSTIAAIPSRSGSGFHASRPQPPARGWLRAAAGEPPGASTAMPGDPAGIEHRREVVAGSGTEIEDDAARLGGPRASPPRARGSSASSSGNRR